MSSTPPPPTGLAPPQPPASSVSPAPAPAPTPAPTPAPGQTTGSSPPCFTTCPVAPPAGFVVTPAELQPQRSPHDDAEYRRNFVAAEMTNALFALHSGWRGQGVLVGD